MNNKGQKIDFGKCYTITWENYIIHTFGVVFENVEMAETHNKWNDKVKLYYQAKQIDWVETDQDLVSQILCKEDARE
jgi:hypothetical protein